MTFSGDAAQYKLQEHPINPINARQTLLGHIPNGVVRSP